MAVTYCTVAEVRAATNNTDLADIAIVDDTALTAKIEAAEVYIDSEAGYWERAAGKTQTRVFPRLRDVENGSGSTIPDRVKQATIAQVEFMYENMPDRDHGIMQDEKPTVESISPRARKLMRGFVCKTGAIELATPWNPDTL